MRARNIKPGYFKSDVLAELPPLTRILFSGLWCIADCAGRMEDRPKRIKADALPYDECDVDAMLDNLEESGFILRYGTTSGQFIQVLNFEKHQNPHKNEAPSTIEAPESNSTSTVQAPESNSTSTVQAPESNSTSTVQAPESNSTSTVQAPESHTTNPADSLIPDSLIPDSLIPDTGFLIAEERVTALPLPHVSATAEALLLAPWINDECAAVEKAVARSFALVPDFNTRDGPLEGEKFGRHHAKKPPDDWYRAWLNWTKNAVKFAKEAPPSRNVARVESKEQYAARQRRWTG